MVRGTRNDAEALRDEVTAVLAPMGLRLSVDKTRVCHIDEGFDFLGWRIQRRARRSRTNKTAVYTYPSKKSLASVVGKVRRLTKRAKHRTLSDLLRRLNPVLRGWCNYFRHGVSKRTFGYLDHYAFWRIVRWLKKRHLGLNMHTLVRRYLPRWEINDGGTDCSDQTGSQSYATATGAPRFPHHGRAPPQQRHEHMESRMQWKLHVRFGGRAGETHQPKSRKGAPVRPYTYIPTKAGFLYLAVVIDVWSRRVVGWSMRDDLATPLVTNALDMAIEQRKPDGVIHHSDRGSQTRFTAFGARCERAGVAVSMGRRGDAYDCDENGGVAGSGLTLATTGHRVPLR